MNDELLLVTEAGYPWAIGGVTTWISDLVAGLTDRRITVLGLRFDTDVEQQPLPLLPRGVRFIDVRLKPGIEAAQAVSQAMAACQASALGAPGIIHATSTGFAGLVALELSQELGAPLVVTEHGIAWLPDNDVLYSSPLRFAEGGNQGGNQGNQGGNQGNQGGNQGNQGGNHGGGGGHPSVLFWDRAGRATARRIYEHADIITSVSAANTAFQRRLAPATAPIRVIPNGVQPGDQAGSGAEPARMHRPRTIVYAGRLAPEKGLDRFIEIAALLGSRHRSLRFEVRGPGGAGLAYRAACERLGEASGLADRLVFTGPLPRRQLFDGADLLIAPSRLDACPYVLLEARAAGVPVVCSQAGDSAAIVAGAGMAVVGEARVFATAVASLLDPDTYAAAASATRAPGRTSYDTMLSGYRTLYADVSAKRRVRRGA